MLKKIKMLITKFKISDDFTEDRALASRISYFMNYREY